MNATKMRQSPTCVSASVVRRQAFLVLNGRTVQKSARFINSWDTHVSRAAHYHGVLLHCCTIATVLLYDCALLYCCTVDVRLLYGAVRCCTAAVRLPARAHRPVLMYVLYGAVLLYCCCTVYVLYCCTARAQIIFLSSDCPKLNASNSSSGR